VVPKSRPTKNFDPFFSSVLRLVDDELPPADAVPPAASALLPAAGALLPVAGAFLRLAYFLFRPISYLFKVGVLRFIRESSRRLIEASCA